MTTPGAAAVGAPLTDPLMSTSSGDRWWTSVNTAEAMQGVLTPLDFTFQSRGIELGGRRSWRDFGVLTKREVYLPTDPNDSFMGAFYGRIGINVNFSAALMDRLPGASGADIEMSLLGFAREGVAYAGTDRKRIPFVLVGSQAVRRTQGRRLAEAEARLRGWWTETLGRLGAGRASAHETLVDASDRFDEAMYLHLRTRFLLIMAQSRLATALDAAGMADALQPLTAAVGTAESDVADALWQLSRGTVTLADFLAEHGYHGPGEGALSSLSWREDPQPVTLSAKALAAQPDTESPRARRGRTTAAARELEQRFVSASTRRRRAAALVAFARKVTAWTEHGKLLTLLALDVGRTAARDYGAELAAEGTLDAPEDVYHLTIGEIRRGPLPPNARELVAFRRSRREEYLTYDVPLTWAGNPEPIVVASASTAAADEGTVKGVGCSAGVYEGQARLVFDPATETLDAGEVLVCATTDPSWLGVFALAGAVVVDIGGPTSHGAIVAREFGLPCVMGTVAGTRQIRSGDRVRVDGAAGTVEILRPLGP